MTLLEELRNGVGGHPDDWDVDGLLRDAADEIERLRGALEETVAIADGYSGVQVHHVAAKIIADLQRPAREALEKK